MYCLIAVRFSSRVDTMRVGERVHAACVRARFAGHQCFIVCLRVPVLCAGVPEHV